MKGMTSKVENIFFPGQNVTRDGTNNQFIELYSPPSKILVNAKVLNSSNFESSMASLWRFDLVMMIITDYPVRHNIVPRRVTILVLFLITSLNFNYSNNF